MNHSITALLCVTATLWLQSAFAEQGGTATNDDNTSERTHKLQVGLNIIATYDEEHPFLNKAKSLSGTWRFNTFDGRIQGQDAIDKGFINPETSMPQNLPSNLKYVAGGTFLREAKREPVFIEGDYTLRWAGKGHGTMQAWERHHLTGRSKNSAQYRVIRQKPAISALAFEEVGDGFGKIEFFNTAHTDLLEQGEIWNPTFIDFAKRHDIIRTMNYQSGGAWPQRTFDDIATMDEFWGQKFSLQWPQAKFFGTPYEAVFNLGVKTERELWVHAPLQIGSPISQGDPTLRRNDRNDRTDFDAFERVTTQNAIGTIDSDEWEKFADAFAERFLASGYPLDRPLYVEVGNEVWNYNHAFKYGTIYATGIARAYDKSWNKRHGYGILTARWMIALEAAFKKLDAEPNIIYVVASQTPSARSTQHAFDGIRFYLEKNNLNTEHFIAKTGVAITGYYGFARAISPSFLPGINKENTLQKWEAAIKQDPKGLEDRIVNAILNGPASITGTKNWLLTSWALQEKIAKKNGSQFIGAYEGGSHFVPHHTLKKSEIFKAWWKNFHWSEKSADIGRQINLALIEAHPDAVISNFGTMGETGANPWVDGHYANWTPMLEMWDEFAIPGHTGSPFSPESKTKLPW